MAFILQLWPLFRSTLIPLHAPYYLQQWFPIFECSQEWSSLALKYLSFHLWRQCLKDTHPSITLATSPLRGNGSAGANPSCDRYTLRFRSQVYQRLTYSEFTFSVETSGQTGSFLICVSRELTDRCDSAKYYTVLPLLTLLEGILSTSAQTSNATSLYSEWLVLSGQSSEVTFSCQQNVRLQVGQLLIINRVLRCLLSWSQVKSVALAVVTLFYSRVDAQVDLISL